ncbi:MAG TPA: hypothetical protein DEP32_08180 [Pseudomonas sp.]|nr:hypothetical protein [Pseudomonas sp.]MBB49286.1 hypothetical protein [Pseudomonadales bacterium]MBO07514.1 hypothetical protein [Acidobacteriota bacterium]HCA24130.1 hypothetical protein [Pseudomonas sp.]|tara:strand:- start:2833 stop:3441 length:609 start_codon:yes stop_codon:yes gene_type:complete
MKADWDDAPIRVRKKTNHVGILVSVAMTLGIFGGAAYMAESKGWINLQPEQAARVTIERTTAKRPPSEPTAQDNYDEQVNRLLRESAEQAPESTSGTQAYQQAERAPVTQERSSDRDRASQAEANLAILNAAPWGSGVQSQPQQESRRGSYVNVVEETKRSCWMSPEGSAACRKARQLMQQADRRSCEIGGNQYACDRANRY